MKRLTKKLREGGDAQRTASGKKKKKSMFSLQELLVKDVEALATSSPVGAKPNGETSIKEEEAPQLSSDTA